MRSPPVGPAAAGCRARLARAPRSSRPTAASAPTQTPAQERKTRAPCEPPRACASLEASAYSNGRQNPREADDLRLPIRPTRRAVLRFGVREIQVGARERRVDDFQERRD